MGNQASNQYEQINKSDYTFTYQLLKKVTDRHYGEIKVIRDIKTGDQLYLREIILTTKATYDAEMNFYNKRANVSHPNVVKIYGCNGQDAQNFCSSYYKISVFIEMLPKTLLEELESRIETDIPFSENDILLIAENLMSGLSYFEAQNVFHGDIRPENIFVAGKSYKLSDPYLDVLKDSNALVKVMLNSAKTLVAPELLAQIPQRDFNIRGNKFKADVFSLGATLLSLASLTHSQDLYDYDNADFSWELLAERLELVRRTYSKFTFDLIRDMLHPSQDSRPDFISLSNRLLPYQEDIRNREELPFFGIRAPFEEREEEEGLDIDRYTYEEKANPILQDFINSQMLQTTTRKGVVRAEREDEHEDYNLQYADHSNYDQIDDAHHHHHHMDGQGYPHEHEREFYYEEAPRYQEEQVVQSGIRRQQYATNEAPRQMQIDPSPVIESNVPTSRSTQIRHENYNTNYSETIKPPVIETQTQSYQAYSSVKAPYENIEKSLPQNPIYQQQPQAQPKVQPPTTGSPDLDDLEAKIKAALERSEATYRRAYKPSIQSSPNKVPGLEQTEANSYLLQTPSTQYYSTNYGGYDISDASASRVGGGLTLDRPSEFDEASYMKQSDKNFLYSAATTKALDKLTATPNQSDLPTNVASTENTFYDGLSAYSSQPIAKNYTTTTYNIQSYQPTYTSTSHLAQDHTASSYALTGSGIGVSRYGVSDQGLYGYSSLPKTDFTHTYDHKSQAQNLTQLI